MHIEPGVVDGAKLLLGAATGAAAGVFTLKRVVEAVREKGVFSLAARAVACVALVFCFFQVLPHYPVGVSEVHFILGSTLFLLFGAAPAAIGLALGLLLQGVLVAPIDLPQYGMNITTLLVPLFGLQMLASRIIEPGTAYVDLTYRQTLALSTTYQAGIVAWVAFWAAYGSGFGVANLTSIATFGAAYMMVVLIEPLVDLAVLAAAKSVRGFRESGFFTSRLYNAS